jgi:hypothetical protein
VNGSGEVQELEVRALLSAAPPGRAGRTAAARGLAIAIALAVASGSAPFAHAAEEAFVRVVADGQYYHRAAHLVVDGVRTVLLRHAIRDGYAPCPECSPPVLEGDETVDPGVTAYYAGLLAQRASGETGPLHSASGTLRPAPAAGSASVIRIEIPAAPSPPRAPPAVPSAPPDSVPVPGSGGLLRVPTFPGSGGVIAVPLPYGGYTILDPISVAPASPPAQR